MYLEKFCVQIENLIINSFVSDGILTKHPPKKTQLTSSCRNAKGSPFNRKRTDTKQVEKLKHTNLKRFGES